MNMSTIERRRNPQYLADAIWINFGSSKDSRVGYDGANNEWTVQSKDVGGTQTDRFRIKANQDITRFELYNDDPAATGVQLDVHHDSASPAASDTLFDLRIYGEDDGGAKTHYGGLTWVLVDPVNASEDGRLDIKAMVAGTLTTTLQVASDLTLSPTGDIVFRPSGASQDYHWSDRDSSLTLQSQTAGSVFDLDLHTADGDATDNIALSIWGRGVPTSITNRERMQVGFITSGNIYRINIDAAGTGTARDLQIQNDGTSWMTFVAGGAVQIPNRSLDLVSQGSIINVGNAGNDWTATGITTLGSVAIGVAGSDQGTLTLAGVTSGVVTIAVAAVAGTWTMTLPTAAGGAGEQLTDAAGDGVTSWAAASSLKEEKNIIGIVDRPQDGLDRILNTRVYRFNYRDGMGTGDRDTEYWGIMADEAPWAMHYRGGIVNPVNTLGYMVLGFQAISGQVRQHETRFSTVEDRVGALEEAQDILRAQVVALGGTPEA